MFDDDDACLLRFRREKKNERMESATFSSAGLKSEAVIQSSDLRCGFSGYLFQPETFCLFFFLNESEEKRQMPKSCLSSSAAESNAYSGTVRECGLVWN